MGKYGNIIPVLYVSIVDLELQRKLESYFDEIRTHVTPSIGGDYDSGQYNLNAIEDHFAGGKLSRDEEAFIDYCRNNNIEYIEI